VRKPKDLPNWESWIDQQIREAQERGEFDDLPGKGQPLDLAPNPYAQDQELAFKVLKYAGYAPEWIELDKAIREKAKMARASLVRKWEWYTTKLDELAGRTDSWARAERQRVEASWSQAVDLFEEQMEAINNEIAELNLQVPSLRFQRARMNAPDEIEHLTQ
jgi:DnaJ family protein C protein 28